jgi:hypothetical protein
MDDINSLKTITKLVEREIIQEKEDMMMALIIKMSKNTMIKETQFRDIRKVMAQKSKILVQLPHKKIMSILTLEQIEIKMLATLSTKLAKK